MCQIYSIGFILYRIKTVHCSSFSFSLLNDGDVKSVSDESDGEENDGYDAITEVVVVDIITWSDWGGKRKWNKKGERGEWKKKNRKMF